MPYTKQTWTDWTGDPALAPTTAKANAARLGTIETGIQNAQAAAETATATSTVASMPSGMCWFVRKQGTTWPSRPTSRVDELVFWVGADPSPPIVTTGTGGMLDNMDLRVVTP